MTQVFPNMPAALAGLQSGDTLLTFDGKPVESFLQLTQFVQAKQPGDVVAIEYQRDNGKQVVQVRLAGFASPLPGSLGEPEG